jgi:predicted transcriptional regulator
MAVTLDKALQERLDAAASRLQRSPSDLLSEALEAYLEQHGAPRQFASLGAGENADLDARDAKQIVREAWDQR